MRSKLALLFVALLLLVPARAAVSIEDTALLIKNGKDEEALKICLQLDEMGQGSFGLYYNQGLAYKNLGRLAEARAAFERCLLLKPSSILTRRQLQGIKENLSPHLDSLEVVGTPWWSQAQGETLVIIPSLVLFLSALASKARKKNLASKAVLGLTILSLVSAATIGLGSPAQERAILIDQNANLLVEPKIDSASESQEALPAGLMLEVVAKSGHFFEVRLGDGRTGWLRNAQLVALKLPKS